MKAIKFNSKLLILLIVIVGSASLYSCKGASRESINYGDFKVEFLFEKDGCKMYRFKDGGRYIYWSSSAGKTQSNSYHTTGKTSYTEHMESISN